MWDFFAARKEQSLLGHMGYKEAYFIKGKEPNRKSLSAAFFVSFGAADDLLTT
jgi:hypothetical protein